MGVLQEILEYIESVWLIREKTEQHVSRQFPFWEILFREVPGLQNMWLLSLILTERSRSLQPEKNMTAPCLYFERSGLLWEQRWSKESSSSYAAKSGVFVDRKKGLYSIEVITQPDHMSTACSFRQRAPDPHGCLPSTFWARDIRVQNRRWDIWGSREAKKKT